jgi:hypothetical protein
MLRLAANLAVQADGADINAAYTSRRTNSTISITASFLAADHRHDALRSPATRSIQDQR